MDRASWIWCRKSAEGREFETGLCHPKTGTLCLSTQQLMGTFFESETENASKEQVGFVEHFLCPKIQWDSEPNCLYGNHALRNLYLFSTTEDTRYDESYILYIRKYNSLTIKVYYTCILNQSVKEKG